MLHLHDKEKMTSFSVTFEDIRLAQSKISPILTPTPISILSCPKIDTHVYLKLDMLQRTGSFKERGALNALLKIQETTQCKRVIGASAGNHAQAVSYHGSKLGFEVSMIMPEQTPLNKVLSTQKWGAKVELSGETVDQGIAVARQRAKDEKIEFIHAFDDPHIIAGQGVMGLEVLDAIGDMDYFIVPVGGGGYIAGTAMAVKQVNPKIKVIGVQTESYPQVMHAFKNQTFESKPLVSTIADGIAVKGIGEHTLPLMKHFVDDVVLVSDEDIADAILYLLQNRKILAEGAGAAGFAALLSEKIKIPKGKKVCTPICGGNIDMNLLSRIVEKGFLKNQRLLKLNVIISDRPGSLHKLTGILAELKVNILNIHHDRVSTNIPFYNTGTELMLETRGEEHAKEVIDRLQNHCYSVKVRS